jgi:hypothetical protein
MEISLINVNVAHKRVTSVFPGELAAKNLPANALDTGSIPDQGKDPTWGRATKSESHS